jgi:hypothetical protein
MNILLNHYFCDLLPLQKKKVRFSEIVNCVLIPSCRDLFFIKEELWWSGNECDFFYYSSVREINNFIINHNPALSFKQGKDLLYQSGIDNFDDSYYK